MIAASAVLFAVASELAEEAKDSLPKLRNGEIIQREWLEDCIFCRETSCNGEKFISQFDFRQRKSRRMAIGGDSND